MNKTETYNKIREICNKHIHERLKLTFGCEVLVWNHDIDEPFPGLYRSLGDIDDDNINVENWGPLHKSQIKNLGKPVSLQDILRVLEHVRWDFVLASLDLTRSIQDQEPEVLDQLLKIME